MKTTCKYFWTFVLLAMIGCDDAPAQDGTCCPISPAPACCMEYGGSRAHFSCGYVCDGMPLPNDPVWERRTDENGCPYWSPLTPPVGNGCGAPRPPARPDAQSDADAPAPEPDARTDGDAPAADTDARTDGDALDLQPDARTDGDGDDADLDASTDGDARDDSDGSRCCPISPAPACCMQYGGSSQFCGTVCDGMPWPDYPGWERRMDANGCPYWWTPVDAPRGCGAIVPEPRIDAALPDTLSDAPADADGEGSSPDAPGSD